MSNPVCWPPLRGLIVEAGQVVGGLDLPDHGELFIAQFEHEYARLGWSVAPAVPAVGETRQQEAGPTE